MAALVAAVLLPTTSSQLPPEVTDAAAEVLCPLDTGAEDVLGLGCPTFFSGTLTGTSSLSPNDPDAHHIAFEAVEGNTVSFEVQNVDNAADIWACVTSTPAGFCGSGSGTNPNDLRGDDEIDCTVSVSPYGCPQGTGALGPDLDADGVYYVHVGTWTNPGGSSAYEGFVSVEA